MSRAGSAVLGGSAHSSLVAAGAARQADLQQHHFQERSSPANSFSPGIASVYIPSAPWLAFRLQLVFLIFSNVF